MSWRGHRAGVITLLGVVLLLVIGIGGYVKISSSGNQQSISGSEQVTKNLTEVDRLNGGNVATQPASVNGEWFANSLVFEANKDYPVNATEYDLSRDWQTLQATIGVGDKAPDITARLQFDVYGDGCLLKREVVRFGESKSINIDVSGVLRLKLVVRYLPSESYSAQGVWGNAQLLRKT